MKTAREAMDVINEMLWMRFHVTCFANKKQLLIFKKFHNYLIKVSYLTVTRQSNVRSDSESENNIRDGGSEVNFAIIEIEVVVFWKRFWRPFCILLFITYIDIIYNVNLYYYYYYYY